MVLNGMAGNINHLDMTDASQAPGFAEAERIGEIYAETALRLLGGPMHPLDEPAVTVGSSHVDVPRVTVPPKEIDAAMKALKDFPIPTVVPVLHSVDIAAGDRLLRSLFAQKKIAFAREAKTHETLEVGALGIGDLVLVGLPMEPFYQIGAEIRRRSPFRFTVPLELLNGFRGYLPTREACARPGGMETLPGISDLRSFVPQAADILTDAAVAVTAKIYRT